MPGLPDFSIRKPFFTSPKWLPIRVARAILANNKMERQRIVKPLELTLWVLGLAACGWAIYGFPYEKIDVPMTAFFFLTIAIGPRVTIKVPRFKSYISASETFIFLALLLYGGEAAILLAAAEAFATSWTYCTKKRTVFVNTATIAFSTSCAVVVLKVAGVYEHFHSYNAHPQAFLMALLLLALVQFLVNTSVASTYGALRDGTPIFETWQRKYIWAFLTYIVGAAASGALVQLADTIGIGIVLIAFPVCFFVFYSYRMYLQNVEISMEQAEQAKKYASLLESQSGKLRESEERFRSAFNYAPIGIGLVSGSGEWLKTNFAMTEILGYSEDEFRRMNFQDVVMREDLGATLVKVHEIMSGRSATAQMEQRYRHKDGYTVWTSWSVSSAQSADQGMPNLIFQLQDITEKKLAEARLRHEATHDALTGLANRAHFMKRLDVALGRVHSSGSKVSILFIDLDRFKVVNDSLGHLVGDELLRCIASRLRDCMRPSDLVARLGGDEFTILVEGSYDDQEVTRIAERIQDKFSRPFDLFGHEVYSSASIGILHASSQHVTPEDLMRDADTAMYQAKRAGKARHEVFDEGMHTEAKETLQLETDLRRAIEQNELSLAYQPIFRLATNELEGVEALVRWDHPTLGLISPTKFVQLAEEIGLIDKLCDQVLAKACRDLRSLHNESPSLADLTLSVNLSSKQFGQSSIHNICSILDETAFPPQLLKLEITESVFFEHTERAVAMLNTLRDLGIDINVDDFGTGYSNLSYLTKLPISTLKVDRSFVSMIKDETGSEVVHAIVTLARNLGLRVVAEGIETQEQLNYLRDLRCESGQGYYLSMPMPFDDLVELAAAGTKKYDLLRPNAAVAGVAAIVH